MAMTESFQKYSMSVLAAYEKDTSGISELCRTCLCKTNDEYVSIQSILPWSKLESCSSQQMIEKILNKELCKGQPQPQRICAKCIKKIKAIALFRSQCVESENTLIEFQKNLQNKTSEIQNAHIHHDFLFDIDYMFPEPISDKFLPVFDSDLLKFESNVLEELKRDLNHPDIQMSLTALEQPKEIIPVKLLKPPTKKKLRKAEKLNDVDIYVNRLLREDISAGLKSLVKKEKKDKTENGFSGLCEQCGLNFSNSIDYKKHIRSHEDKAKQTFKFTCNFCSKGFNHKQTYNIHHNSHTRAIKYICDMCGKELATKNSLRIHFRYHLGIKNHVCPKCGHRFVTPRELRDHVEKKHAAVRAIACTYSDCSETFDSEYRLNLHLRVHETNYAFVCDVCGVATVSKFRLGIHKKIHTGEMIRQCPICQKSLAHDNALRRHIRNVHGEKKTSNRPMTTPKLTTKPHRMITLDGIILTT